MARPELPTRRTPRGAPQVLRRVTFAELVRELAAEGQVVPERGEAMIARERSQRAFVDDRNAKQAKVEGLLAAPATVIDLVLSFGERDSEDRPLREDAVTATFAKLVGLDYVKLDPLELDPVFVVRSVPKPFARKHGFLAIDATAEVLRIATYMPYDAFAIESLERVNGKQVVLVIASRSDVDRLILEFYGFRQSIERAERQMGSGVDLGNFEQLVRMKTDAEIEASDQHVVHAVDYMFRYAFGQRASDIHIEPKREDGVVRFRIDGALHAVIRLPRVVHNAVVNRIKTLSRLDIAEKRRPQDGRIKTEWQGKSTEVRVSTLPVAFGEKLVLRIFDPAIVSDDFGALGFFERDRVMLDEMLRLPHGVVLVTGPTGSGKTTTLYTALRKLATDDVNITTIEDPIENIFEGLNQTAVQSGIGLGFAEILRTILRQDPDIIMVGEIRDLETARHAVQASLTGHLVFSTLHTNDAPSAITRLVDLGIPRFLLSSTISSVLAQRLVRKVCGGCAEERYLSDAEAEVLGLGFATGLAVVREGKGCADCRNTGYVGRTTVVELFRVTPEIRRLIHDGATEERVREAARRDGMLTLRESAIQKMLAGETSFLEVVETTSGFADDDAPPEVSAGA